MIFTSPFLPIDNLSLFMLVMIAVLLPLVLMFSLSYVRRNFFRYYFVLILTSIGLVGVVLARDWLSFYIFLEMMTVGIYFLIIDNKKKESFPAGFKYILMMFAGGLFILVAALLLYNLTGTFDMAAISQMAAFLPRSSLMFIFALFIIGCLVELGAVPFHVWLPDAHPVAPSPISALLSGVAIKIGAYGIIRMMFTLKLLSPSLIYIGVISMLFGVILALQQTNVKRLLAYHSISQMGYVLLGLGLGSGLGIGGALFHMLNHATFKMLLFLCMGAVIYATGQREIAKLGGLGKRMPITVLTFGVGALAISGIPPFNGFASKAMLASAISGNILLKAALIITAAGTLASFLKLFLHVFAGKLPRDLEKTKEVPFLMCLAMLILAGLSLAIGIMPSFVLTDFVAQAVDLSLKFKFWTVKHLIDTAVISLLGVSIYALGMKLGLLKVKAKGRVDKISIISYLSLDRLYCSLATFIETLFNLVKNVMRRSINVYSMWIFLTLAVLIFTLWYASFLW